MPREDLTDLELLLGVSSKLVEQAPTESILQAVCEGVNDLGFQKALVELGDATGVLSPVPEDEAHRLLVPLRDQSGAIVGRIWADEPEEGLPPSTARPQILALFANLASMAITSAGEVERLRDEDALTGTANRRAFMRQLEVEVQRALRYGRPLTLVLCDVDHFKLLNDTHGHPGGDRALCHVADVLKTGLRTGDGAFRIGGDEFALLLPETTGPQAAAAVRRVSEAFEAHTDPPFTGLRVSCGVATLPSDAADGEALIRQADLALYAEKRARQEPARRPVIAL
jgi:diguanylate cyclase (GGDEF)-like protein